MRVWGVLAVLLSLCACDASPTAAGALRDSGPSAAYDVRYAYRLPTHRIKSVQDSHAAGCDRLGAARCRVTAIRYAVAGAKVDAMLALKIDPALARDFGQAATQTVIGARGTLLESDIAGGGARDALLPQLRTALAGADSAARAGDALAATKAMRLRAALATLAEIDPAATSSVATTAVILTYVSGTAATEPSFAAAGPALFDSLAGLAVLLAGVGPWLLLLLGGALLLRRIVPSAKTPEESPAPFAIPRAEPEDRGNVIRRWFQREPENID